MEDIELPTSIEIYAYREKALYSGQLVVSWDALFQIPASGLIRKNYLSMATQAIWGKGVSSLPMSQNIADGLGRWLSWVVLNTNLFNTEKHFDSLKEFVRIGSKTFIKRQDNSFVSNDPDLMAR